jgi:hypothetical protein
MISGGFCVATPQNPPENIEPLAPAGSNRQGQTGEVKPARSNRRGQSGKTRGPDATRGGLDAPACMLVVPRTAPLVQPLTVRKRGAGHAGSYAPASFRWCFTKDGVGKSSGAHQASRRNIAAHKGGERSATLRTISGNLLRLRVSVSGTGPPPGGSIVPTGAAVVKASSAEGRTGDPGLGQRSEVEQGWAHPQSLPAVDGHSTPT